MNKWYPSEQQLDSPERLRATLQQVLEMHYDLANRHDDLHKRVAATPLPGSATVGSGPATTSLLGLPVGPVDTTRLADGVKLTYVKSAHMFIFQ